jgi:hypothetical protein
VSESPKTYDLVQRVKSPTGGEQVKVVAFHKEPRAGGSQVAAYILYEPNPNPGAKGPRYQTVCSAVITDSQVVPLGNGRSAVLPSVVRLECQQPEKMELKMDLGKVRVNVPFDQNRSNDLFTRRTLNRLKSYDLARGPDTPGGEIRPTGGFAQ